MKPRQLDSVQCRVCLQTFTGPTLRNLRATHERFHHSKADVAKGKAREAAMAAGGTRPGLLPEDPEPEPQPIEAAPGPKTTAIGPNGHLVLDEAPGLTVQVEEPKAPNTRGHASAAIADIDARAQWLRLEIGKLQAFEAELKTLDAHRLAWLELSMRLDPECNPKSKSEVPPPPAPLEPLPMRAHRGSTLGAMIGAGPEGD